MIPLPLRFPISRPICLDSIIKPGAWPMCQISAFRCLPISFCARTNFTFSLFPGLIQKWWESEIHAFCSKMERAVAFTNRCSVVPSTITVTFCISYSCYMVPSLDDISLPKSWPNRIILPAHSRNLSVLNLLNVDCPSLRFTTTIIFDG